MRFLMDVSWTPDPSALPGYNTFHDMVNAVGAFALLGCLVAALAGGVMWAFGSGSSNAASAAGGRKMVVGAIVGALVIGAASILINTFYGVGTHLH